MGDALAYHPPAFTWPRQTHRLVLDHLGDSEAVVGLDEAEVIERDASLLPCFAAGIVAAAAAGDEHARESVATYERRLARGLASVVNVFDPDAIVLGGGVSNIARLYERVPRLWAEFVFSDAIVTRLVRAVHGDSSGVRGAAWLWD